MDAAVSTAPVASAGILRASSLQPLGVGRQRVGLPVLLQLQAVLQVAQELVGGSEARVLAAGEEALVAQAEEREHRAAVPHPRLAAAVQALQALHQELDVADAAGRELDVERRCDAAPRRQFFADALARFGDRLHGAEIERALVDQRLDELQQAARRARGRPPRRAP